MKPEASAATNSGLEGAKIDLDAVAAAAEAAVSSKDWAAAAAAFETLVAGRPKQPELRYELANAYEELGRLDDAIAVLTHPSIAGRDKTNRRLAKTYIEAKHFDAAMPLVETLIAAWPGNDKYLKWKAVCDLSSRIQQAQDLVGADRQEEAEHLYQAILADYPEAARPYLHLGQIYAQQSKWREAIPAFRTGLDVEPENLKLRAGLARALFKNGQAAEAIAVIENIEQCDADADCQYLLQRCYAELHDWRRVEEVAGRLLSILPPDDPLRDTVTKARNDAHFQHDAAPIDAMAAAGDLEGAIWGYRELAVRHPQSALAGLKLGNALADAGRDPEAAAALRDAVEMHPEDPDLRAALTRVVLRSADEEEILRHARKSAASGHGDFESLRWLARYYGDRDEWAQCLDAAKQALALDPESSSARILVVRALMQLDRLAEALAELETLLASGEKRVEALQLKGDTLVRLGRAGEAIRTYCQALRLSRRDPQVTEGLNRALQRNATAEDFPLRPLEDLPVAVDPAQIGDLMRPFLGSETDDRSWNKRHRKLWRRSVDRVATGREAKRDRDLVEREYAVWATMGFDRYRTDREELQGMPWSWRDQRLFLDGAAAARLRTLFLSAALDQLKPRRVLEVGSGNGINLLSLAGAFPDIEFVGLELTQEGVDQARRAQADSGTVQIIHDYSPLEIADTSAIARISFVQGDASAMPFEDNSFDLVITILAVEQMESVRSAALSEIARVSSGHVLMLEPFRDLNQSGLKALYVWSRGYFRGSIGELREFGLEPLWATADFPQETFLGTALVLSEKQASSPSDQLR